ncbi:MAG: SusC/RagA family TonB-linked outer membrane protein [Dysgonomonas sp.]
MTIITNIMGKKSIGLLLLLLFSISAFSQNIDVKGTVSDSQTKERLIGVTVVVKGSSNGVTTDADGNFAISVAKNSTLVFSYLGYDPREIVVSSNSIQLELRPQSFELENIVVVGTRMKKSDLTGAVSGITDTQLKEVPTSDLSTAMQGKVPGLFVSRTSASPGGDITVKVRGINSINYGQEPLYIVDGMVVEQGLKLINPDDVESIEVLKDASSTALYGSRASNGVIVITTKKGKKGEGKVNYSGFITVSKYQDRLKRLDSNQLYNLRIDAYANAYMDANPGADRQSYIDNVLLGASSVVGSIFSEEELYNGQNNLTSNWLDDILRTGFSQNHAVNISGSDDNTSYYLGFNYSKEEGILKNSDYERFGGKINLDRKVKPWLRIGTNTILSRGIRDILEGDAYNIAFRGNPLQTKDTERYYMYWQGVAQMGDYNPLLSLDIERQQIHDRVLSSNYIEVNPIKDMFIRTTLALDIFNKQDNSYTPSYVGQSVRDNYNGVAWQWRSQDMSWQWDNSVSYEKTFNEKHRIFGLLSSSISRKKYNELQVQGFGFPFDNLGYHDIGSAGNKTANTMSSYFSTYTLASFIGRINYSYEHKYYLTATARRDGSSRFASDNQWGTFPSFSAAWNMKEENFMEKATWLDQLKLRAGFGFVGNQAIPDYSYLTIYNSIITGESVGLTPADRRYGNENVRWEKQKSWNFGVDATFLNNRISITADAFHVTNSDLLMSMNYYPSFGFDYSVANVAELENQGLEFSVNALVVDTKDFKWNVSGNIAHDRNKIKSLYNGLSVIWNGGSVRNRDGQLFVGQSLNSIYSLKFGKIAQESDMDYVNSLTSIADGKIIRPGDYLPVDVDGDGAISYEKDMVIIGKKDPKFYGGFTSNFSYKDFSFEAAFTYSYGAKKFSGVYESLMSASGTSVASIDMLDRWTPEHTNTDVPRAFASIGQNRFSLSELSNSVQDASFLRCAAMTLSYNVPKNFIGAFFNNIKVYATAGNLFLITPYKGYDPEAGEDYPLTSSYTLGVNLSF